jgi:AraC-like DNA-binding protein
MRQSGLPVLCDDPNTYAPLSRLWSFFDIAARHEDPELGWRIGAHVGDKGLNTALLRKLESAPTLLQALRRFSRMARTEATGTEIGIQEQQSGILFYTRYSGMGQEPGYHISQSYQLGVILDLIRHFLGRHWIPEEIGIESSRIPSFAEEYFPGSRFLLQQPAGYIAVPRSCLHQAPPTGGTKAGSAEDLLLSGSMHKPHTNTVYLSQFQSVLSAYLSEGYISQRIAAELMDTSIRTLTRRLSAYGLTYGMLIDGLRFKVAKEELCNTDMPIYDIAQSVGFRNQGSFTRMYRRIGGMNPKEFRDSAKYTVRVS